MLLSLTLKDRLADLGCSSVNGHRDYRKGSLLGCRKKRSTPQSGGPPLKRKKTPRDATKPSKISLREIRPCITTVDIRWGHQSPQP